MRRSWTAAATPPMAVAQQRPSAMMKCIFWRHSDAAALRRVAHRQHNEADHRSSQPTSSSSSFRTQRHRGGAAAANERHGFDPMKRGSSLKDYLRWFLYNHDPRSPRIIAATTTAQAAAVPFEGTAANPLRSAATNPSAAAVGNLGAGCENNDGSRDGGVIAQSATGAVSAQWLFPFVAKSYGPHHHHHPREEDANDGAATAAEPKTARGISAVVTTRRPHHTPRLMSATPAFNQVECQALQGPLAFHHVIVSGGPVEGGIAGDVSAFW